MCGGRKGGRRGGGKGGMKGEREGGRGVYYVIQKQPGRYKVR
jgi:hypothetical protein